VSTSEPGSFLSNQAIPRFERRAIGGKIGIGTSKSYFDVVAIKAYDVLDDRMFNDTSAFRPQENTSIDLISQFNLSKDIQYRMDLATSVFTWNTSSDEIELDPSVSWIGNILQPKTSTQVLFAGEIGIGYKNLTWGFN